MSCFIGLSSYTVRLPQVAEPATPRNRFGRPLPSPFEGDRCDRRWRDPNASPVLRATTKTLQVSSVPTREQALGQNHVGLAKRHSEGLTVLLAVSSVAPKNPTSAKLNSSRQAASEGQPSISFDGGIR
jgi:hypothetical protein